MNSAEPGGTSFSPAPAAPRAARGASTSRLNEWQRFFLTRLDHLLSVQGEGEADEAAKNLLSRAVYSTYLDCQSQGVGEQALQRIAASGANVPSSN